MLVEQLVGLDVQRVRRGIPDDLVDPGDGAVGKPHEEDAGARGGGRVDLARERDRDAWLGVEAVEVVQDVDVLAVGGR